MLSFDNLVKFQEFESKLFDRGVYGWKEYFRDHFAKDPLLHLDHFMRVTSRHTPNRDPELGKTPGTKKDNPRLHHYSRNCGIAFNRPEFIRFTEPARKLREQFALDRRGTRHAPPGSEPQTLLKKRPFHTLRDTQPKKEFETEAVPRKSLFESQKSTDPDWIQYRHLVRSLEDKQKSLKKRKVHANSSVANSSKIRVRSFWLKKAHTQRDRRSQLRMIRRIQMADIKGFSDRSFREFVRGLCEKVDQK